MNDQPEWERPEMSRGELLRMAVLFEGGMAVVACLMGWWWGYPPWEVWHLDWTSIGYGAALTLPIFVGFLLFLWRPIGPLRPIGRFMNVVVRPLFASCTVADLAVISILAGVGEEFLFRGVLQPATGAWLGTWGGVAAASVLFGLVHPITPTYVILATLIGAYLGWAFVVTENIVPCVIAHALYDFLALWIVTRRK